MQSGIIQLIAASLLLLTAGSAFSCDGCEPENTLDAKGLAWKRVEFRARKLLIGASSIVEWSVLDTQDAGIDWIDMDGREDVKGRPIEPGARILRLGYAADFLGRHIDTVLWMNPADGAILQYELSDSRRRPKHLINRFTNQGAFRQTWRPQKNEKQMAWQEWTRHHIDFRPFQPEAHDQVVTDSLGLIYLIAASDLGRGTDRLDVLAFGSRDVSRAVLTAGQIVDIDADFIAEGPSGENRCKGAMKALKISLNIEAVGDDIDPDIGFLSDIEMFLSPESRLPLRISGRARFVGRVVIRMKRARMIDDRGCPGRLR